MRKRERMFNTGPGSFSGVSDMGGCSDVKLERLLDNRLGLNAKLRIYDHLDRCEFCREMVYKILCFRDRNLFEDPSFFAQGCSAVEEYRDAS